MTISTLIIKNQYAGDGSQTVFPYTFRITEAPDMSVIIRSVLGVEAVKVFGAGQDYTISNIGITGGGNVTFNTAPLNTDTVFLRRSTAKTQTLDLVENDPFTAESVEGAFDKAISLVQELSEEVGRSIKLSRTNSIGSSEFTDNAAQRAGNVLAFDSTGELQATQELGQSRGNWSANTSYAQRDLVKDSGTANVFLCLTAHTSSGGLPLTSNADIAKWELLVDAGTAQGYANTTAANVVLSNADVVTTAANVVTSNAARDTTLGARDVAIAKRDVAVASASTASTDAATATAKAVIATTKAEESQASAVSAAASAGGGVVRVTASDTNANVLTEKFLAGTDITFSVANAGGDEKLLVSSPFAIVYAIALGG